MAFCCVVTVQVHLFKLEFRRPHETGPAALQDQRAAMGSLPAQEWAEDTLKKQLESPYCRYWDVQLLTLHVAQMMVDNSDVYLRSCLPFY